ncbi:RHS repeat-associated core domain-containing protein, partial [Streptomyces sp. NRRL F-2664]|uniref:RHS repeat-associated core domain-containing protein n=1 Tax=Streptomyces sp. NRRL F-2664 TaxID=1463842 RepID=UPI0004C90EFC
RAYTDYGRETRPDGTPAPAAHRAADPAANPFRFGGEYANTENGTDYTPARLYHPETGRFTTRDPHPTPLNKYQAFDTNPIEHTDPSGNISFKLPRFITRYRKAHNRKLKNTQRRTEAIAQIHKDWVAERSINRDKVAARLADTVGRNFLSDSPEAQRRRRIAQRNDFLYFQSEEFKRSEAGQHAVLDPGAASVVLEGTGFPARAKGAGFWADGLGGQDPVSPSQRWVNENDFSKYPELWVAKHLSEMRLRIDSAAKWALGNDIDGADELGRKAVSAKYYANELSAYNWMRYNQKFEQDRGGGPVYKTTVVYRQDGANRKVLFTDAYTGT